MEKLNLIEPLKYIDPSRLSYQDWVDVGMALKHEGYDCSTWDDWSRADSRYRDGECERKWQSFKGSSLPVTGGTIVQLAKENGFHFFDGSGHELDWDDTINYDGVIVDSTWVEPQDVSEPDEWHPEEQLIKYLEILFEASETVGYVTESWQKEERYLPTKGCFSQTAGQLIEELSKCNGDIGAVIGDYNEAAGAWIRFNPLDGKGVKNENVTEYRYALVESDDMDIEKQNAMVRELELPIACLVHSGGKSLHAIVRVDAKDYGEYRQRVDYLYNILKKNGMTVDTQNKNPSRLSRMPGIIRNGNKQYLVDKNIGKESWAEWFEWIEGINDELPDPESLTSVWGNLPPLSPPLIDGILRQGHKLLLAGPSKAGKSYALIELCCSIAEGKPWMGFPCSQGRILYVNLELDRASCLHRFKDVYNALQWQPNGLHNIDIWNLRGRSVPMDKLAPKLIRRAAKKNYIAIVIDPIYKVITGDENSADQMANFCNQFDKVCTELGCAVIYCHHHSKGSQGGKRSMDRASGSGVFARDPDALLDLIELDMTDDLYKQQENAVIASLCAELLNAAGELENVSEDDRYSQVAMLKAMEELLAPRRYEAAMEAVEVAKQSVSAQTAWRIEGTLREFPRFSPVNLWFRYPVHEVDDVGVLGDIQPEDGYTPRTTWKKNFGKKKSPEEREEDRKAVVESAFGACDMGSGVTLKDLAEYMGVAEKTARRRIKEHGGFWVDEGNVGKK